MIGRIDEERRKEKYTSMMRRVRGEEEGKQTHERVAMSRVRAKFKQEPHVLRFESTELYGLNTDGQQSHA